MQTGTMPGEDAGVKPNIAITGTSLIPALNGGNQPSSLDTPAIWTGEIASNIAEPDQLLIANGYEPVAVIGKRPVADEWQKRANTIEAVDAERAAHPHATNTGLRTGTLVGIDIDLRPLGADGVDYPADFPTTPTGDDGRYRVQVPEGFNPNCHAAAVENLTNKVLGLTCMRRVGSKGAMLCYRNQTPMPQIIIRGEHSTLMQWDNKRNGRVPLKAQVEILGTGRQLVAYGLHPDTGKPYEWTYADIGYEPLDRPLTELEEATPELLREFACQVAELFTSLGYENVKVLDRGDPTKSATHAAKRRTERVPVPEDELIEILGYNSPCDRLDWIRGLAAVRATNLRGVPEDEMDDRLLEIAKEWSRGDYEKAGAPAGWVSDEDVEFHYWTLDPDKPGGATFGTLWQVARDNGYAKPAPDRTLEEKYGDLSRHTPPGAGERTKVAGGGIILTVPASEDDLSCDFTAAYQNRLRYVDKWGAWRAFDGRRWIEAATPAVWNLIKPIARDCAARMAGESINTRKKLLSRATIAAVEALSRGNLLATPDVWDADKWLLNTPAGIVDLRTGELHLAAPEAYCTKITAVAPGGDCPRWRQFLAEVTGGDVELQRYLQRLVGYGLTGLTTEEILVFLYGTGGNGKGVFIKTIMDMLGDYAQAAPMDTFTATVSEQHPTDMARLQGARFVSAQETDKGRAWAEARIKALTGGDRITARFMRQDFFEYDPQFLLVIAGNHKPRLHNVDEAIRRRLHMVPFTVSIPAEKRDLRLKEVLRGEWAGILQWAIVGCQEWQRIGLAPPAVVLNTTAEYLREQDHLAAWIEERCVVAASGWASVAELYDDYQTHTAKGGERPETKREFSDRLDAQGIARKTVGNVRGFAGIGLKTAN
jgi:P4 family phage/plasmid primase-like protien